MPDNNVMVPYPQLSVTVTDALDKGMEKMSCLGFRLSVYRQMQVQHGATPRCTLNFQFTSQPFGSQALVTQTVA